MPSGRAEGPPRSWPRDGTTRPRAADPERRFSMLAKKLAEQMGGHRQGAAALDALAKILANPRIPASPRQRLQLCLPASSSRFSGPSCPLGGDGYSSGGTSSKARSPSGRWMNRLIVRYHRFALPGALCLTLNHRSVFARLVMEMFATSAFRRRRAAGNDPHSRRRLLRPPLRRRARPRHLVLEAEQIKFFRAGGSVVHSIEPIGCGHRLRLAA